MNGSGWIGGARVAVGTEDAQPECANARPFTLSGTATTFV